jgi:hypothetical protein
MTVNPMTSGNLKEQLLAENMEDGDVRKLAHTIASMGESKWFKVKMVRTLS